MFISLILFFDGALFVKIMLIMNTISMMSLVVALCHNLWNTEPESNVLEKTTQNIISGSKDITDKTSDWISGLFQTGE